MKLKTLKKKYEKAMELHPLIEKYKRVRHELRQLEEDEWTVSFMFRHKNGENIELFLDKELFDEPKHLDKETWMEHAFRDRIAGLEYQLECALRVEREDIAKEAERYGYHPPARYAKIAADAIPRKFIDGNYEEIRQEIEDKIKEVLSR